MCVYIYIYIYIYLSLYICIYIYIYICICWFLHRPPREIQKGGSRKDHNKKRDRKDYIQKMIQKGGSEKGVSVT